MPISMVSTAAPGVGLSRAVPLMGTVFSFDLRDQVIDPAVLEAAVQTLRELEARFSPYIPDSEISRIGRGELALEAASRDVQYVLAVCRTLRAGSGGVFDPWGWRADGRLDPSGFVKGWAVDEAGDQLEAAGVRHYAINAGGDLRLRGSPTAGRAWQVAVRHPADPGRRLVTLSIHDGAVATSGPYERGEHIRHPDGLVPRTWTSLTVVGPMLAFADAYATTALAMGETGLAWVEAHPGYAALGYDTHERLFMTAGLERWLLEP